MKYKINYDERSYNESIYTAEVYENDNARRIAVKEDNQAKCYVLDQDGKLLITIGKRNIELDYEEAQFILMGLIVEGFDVGTEVNVEEINV